MIRFGDWDLHLPAWGLFGGAAQRRTPRPAPRGEPGGPLSAEVSFEKVDGLELRVARWRLDQPSENPPILFFNGIGANIEAVAPVASTASATVSKMGNPLASCCPPFPGVTPPTMLVP